MPEAPEASTAFGQTPKAAFKAAPPAHLLSVPPVPPLVPLVQLAQGGSAAASSTDSPRPAGVPPLSQAQAFQRTRAALRARETELREAQRQLAAATAASSEGWAEVRRLELMNSGWRHQHKEQEAQDAAKEAELQELARLLAECWDNLALAEALLASLRDR